jgi:hypothetical protein
MTLQKKGEAERKKETDRNKKMEGSRKHMDK